MTYTLIPASSLFICCCCTAVVAKFNFIQFGEVLLVSSCSSEVALAAVMCDGLVQTPCCGLGVILAIGLCIWVRFT